MKALTIRQPWVYAILRMGKNVENRKWPPPAEMIGHYIALHAGQAIDRTASLDVDADHLVLGAIVGIARIARVTDRMRSPWFSGPVGWVLDDVRELARPIPQKGQLRLWEVDAAALRRIRRAYPDLTL